MQKKVLLTGSSGFLGSQMCTDLLQRNFNITAVDIKKNNNEQKEVSYITKDVGEYLETQENLDNFDIVIKDYSYSPQKYRIEKLLKKLGKNKMLYLSSEQSYKDTILDADILIYPWVSTSFIEGLQTKAEILIFDDSDMIPKTETMLNNCPVFETSVDQFIIEMHNYLHNFELLSTNNDMTIGDINTMKNYFIEPIPVNLIVNKLINSCNN